MYRVEVYTSSFEAKFFHVTTFRDKISIVLGVAGVELLIGSDLGPFFCCQLSKSNLFHLIASGIFVHHVRNIRNFAVVTLEQMQYLLGNSSIPMSGGSFPGYKWSIQLPPTFPRFSF